MDRDTYKMAATLIVSLAVANSIEKFADCRDNVYGDLEKALKRLGPEALKLYGCWLDTNEIIAWENLAKDQQRYVVID